MKITYNTFYNSVINGWIPCRYENMTARSPDRNEEDVYEYITEKSIPHPGIKPDV